MPTVAVLLLIFCQVATQQQSNGQNPEHSSKRVSTEQQAKNHPTPTNQTVVIQSHLEATPDTKHEQPEKERAGKQPHDWVDWLNAFSTFVIAAFTVGMVVVIRIQIREYRIRERAWVTFLIPEKPIVQKKRNGQPDGYSVIGFVKNVGNTPAIVTRKFHFTSVIDKGKSLDLIPPYLQIEESQTEYQMIPEAVEPAIGSLNEFEMLNIRKLEIYVLGQIVYKDVFGEPHETRYCFRYYPEPTVGRQPGFYPEGPSPYLKVT